MEPQYAQFFCIVYITCSCLMILFLWMRARRYPPVIAGCYIRFSFWQSRIFVGLEYLESALSQYQDLAGRRKVSIEWANQPRKRVVSFVCGTHAPLAHEHRISRLICSILMANQIAQLSTYTGHLQQIQESQPIHLFLPGFFSPSFLNWQLKTHIYTWLPFPRQLQVHLHGSSYVM